MLPGREIRDARGVPRVRRQGRACRRQRGQSRFPACARSSCWTISWPSSAIICGPRRQGLGALVITWDEGPNASVDSAQVWKDIKAASEQEGAVAKAVGDAPRRSGRATRSKRITSCRSSRTRPWSRSTAPCMCARRLRNLGRHAGGRAHAGGRGEIHRPAAREGHGAQPALGGGFGRRLDVDGIEKACASRRRSTVRSRWCGRARKTSSTISIVPSITTASRDLEGRQDRRLEASHHRIVGHGALVPARLLSTASTSTASTARSTSPTTFPTCAWNSCATSRPPSRPASGAASAPTTMCSPSKASSTNWRRRRARIRSISAARCWRRRRRVSRGARACGAKGGLGQSALPPRTGPRRRGAGLVRELHRHRRRSGSGSRRRSPRAPHHQRGRHRHCRQSRHHRRAIAGRADLRHSPPRSMARSPSTRAACSRAISTITACCASTDAGDRRASDQERRGARRHRRDRHDGAPPACAMRSMPRPESRCGDCRSIATFWRGGKGMSFFSRLSRVAHTRSSASPPIIALVSDRVFVDRAGPGPMISRAATASRSPIIMAPIRPACRRSSPTRDLVKRGEYLARAADCAACHTAERRRAVCRRPRVRLPFGTIYSANITPDKDTGIGDLERRVLPERASQGHRRRRRASLSGDALCVLHRA
jgi:hypothetical protein